MENKYIAVAIDGPAASGKSTTARLLAKELGFIYIDTGAMYRAATLFVLKQKIDLNNTEEIVSQINKIKLDIRLIDKVQHTFLNERDVSKDIRSSQVDKNVSLISAIPEVRQFMVKIQQKLASNKNVIMDGRDIGTVVLPNADLKVYLKASLSARAERRKKELETEHQNFDLEEIKDEILRRDEFDSRRSASPLKKAADAIEIDTSDLSIKDQVDLIKDHISKIRR